MLRQDGPANQQGGKMDWEEEETSETSWPCLIRPSSPIHCKALGEKSLLIGSGFTFSRQPSKSHKAWISMVSILGENKNLNHNL